MTKKQKLELTWIGKENRPKLEPRILLEDPEKSYHARFRVKPVSRGDAESAEKGEGRGFYSASPREMLVGDIFDNRLIFGDNLLALKALEQEYAGKVKCVFIDPPYNTGSAFTHYDDGVEHSIWLSLMRDRLEIIRNLLSDDGSLWITIDDNEAHYLKVLCDEVFGRASFVSTFAWEKDKGRRNDTDISSAHDHVLLFVKNRELWRKIRNPLPRTDAQKARYRNPDNDPLGPWLQGDNGTAKSGSESARFPITLPSGRVVTPPVGNYWRFSIANFEQARSEGRVYFGANGDGLPVSTSQEDTLSALGGIERENRLEDYLVRALIDFDDISYDAHADLLYDLAGQMVRHLLGYLSEDEARNVLQYYNRQLAEFIHAQMQEKQWETAVDYEVVVSKGFSTLKPSAFTAADGFRHYRQTVDDKSKIGQMVFGGFQRCLYPVQKFDSDTERRFAVLLEKESDTSIQKWFKPAKGQFQIFYKWGRDHLEYQPDFVVETADQIYMVETKARNEMESAEVLAKKEAAVKWCGHATDHARGNGGEPWEYLMVPHDVVAENMTLAGLSGRI